MFTLTSVSVVLFFTSIINAAIFAVGWRRKNSKSGLYFAWGMLGVTIWTFCGALDYAAVSLSLKIMFAKIEAVGYLSAIPLFAVNSIYFAGNDRWLEKAWFKNLLVFIPLASALIVITNEWHGWMWQSYEALGGNIFYFERGAAYSWMMLVYYALLAFIFLNFWMAFYKGSIFVKRQARLMMSAALLPLVTNLIYQLDIPGVKGVDWTSITFSITGAIFLYALHGLRFLDIIPIARDKLFNNLSDGMVVLDTQNRIIDMNHIAANLFKQPVIGTNLAEVEPLNLALANHLIEEKVRTEIVINEAEKRYFDTRISPLYDEKKNVVGRLVLFHDVTERNQARAALEAQLEEIKTLHRELQESQALILEQQRALAKMEERRQIGRDMHDSVNQSVHSLMLFSETLAALLEKNRTAEALNLTRRIQESGAQALKEIRLLVYRAQLISEEQNKDIISALEERLDMVERRAGITAEIIGKEDAAHCPTAYKENLYWLIVESLNNSLKHARAKNIKIAFALEEDQIEVYVEDDGAGFDPQKTRVGGFGMKSMRARAELLGGTFLVASALGGGTRISFKANTEK